MTESDRELPSWVIEAAKNQPGLWVYEVVGDFADGEAVPPESIRGAWKVGDDGKITGSFIPNDSFRG